MKTTVLKIVISVIVVLTTAILVHFLSISNQASSDGTLRIVIVDENGETVFDDDVIFKENDTFFDVLNREFELTCASSSYQPDSTCSNDFQSFSYTGKILLGIAHDDFDVQTDWAHSFLALEIYNGIDYVLTTQGVNNIEFHDQDQIRISFRSVLEGLD